MCYRIGSKKSGSVSKSLFFVRLYIGIIMVQRIYIFIMNAMRVCCIDKVKER